MGYYVHLAMWAAEESVSGPMLQIMQPKPKIILVKRNNIKEFPLWALMYILLLAVKMVKGCKKCYLKKIIWLWTIDSFLT